MGSLAPTVDVSSIEEALERIAEGLSEARMAVQLMPAAVPRVDGRHLVRVLDRLRPVAELLQDDPEALDLVVQAHR